MSRQPHLYAATYALIFNDDGQVLLLQRANTGYYDEARDFPAGHVDDGETVLESIRHECLEEIGIKVDVSESDVCHVIHVVNDDKQYINFCIRIVRWTGEIVNNEPHKCSDLKRFDLNALPEYLTPTVLPMIQGYQNSQWYSQIDKRTKQSKL